MLARGKSYNRRLGLGLVALAFSAGGCKEPSPAPAPATEQQPAPEPEAQPAVVAEPETAARAGTKVDCKTAGGALAFTTSGTGATCKATTTVGGLAYDFKAPDDKGVVRIDYIVSEASGCKLTFEDERHREYEPMTKDKNCPKEVYPEKPSETMSGVFLPEDCKYEWSPVFNKLPGCKIVILVQPM